MQEATARLVMQKETDLQRNISLPLVEGSSISFSKMPIETSEDGSIDLHSGGVDGEVA
jgi:hypothetical protein